MTDNKSVLIDSVREAALKILYYINEEGAYSSISIDKYLEGHTLKDIDKSFITELVYGTIKWRLAIDWVISQFSSVRVKKISPWILNILRLGVYQLLYTDKIPESAACNESVNLSKKYGHSASSRYVNAVLRNIARNKENIKYPDKSGEYKLYLSIKYSHPEWMVDEWIGRFGKEFTEGLLAANNEIPSFSIRVNTLKISKEQLVEHFKDIGIEAVSGKYVDEAMIIVNPLSIVKLDIFKKGYFQVQDESSMLAAKILDPVSGELVMDICAAPGGKATHIAQLMGNKGEVIARDIHEHKIRLLKENAVRLGVDILKPEVFDATVIDSSLVGKADKVLVDAPCTGLGIIRRKPDIKWAKQLEDKESITGLQYKILNAASKYVKPGGILVYSTCTIEREENEDMVKRFLKKNNDFYTVDISSLLPSTLLKQSAKEGYIQLFPNVDNMDGFFISKMKKRG